MKYDDCDSARERDLEIEAIAREMRDECDGSRYCLATDHDEDCLAVSPEKGEKA